MDGSPPPTPPPSPPRPSTPPPTPGPPPNTPTTPKYSNQDNASIVPGGIVDGAELLISPSSKHSQLRLVKSAPNMATVGLSGRANWPRAGCNALAVPILTAVNHNDDSEALASIGSVTSTASQAVQEGSQKSLRAVNRKEAAAAGSSMLEVSTGSAFGTDEKAAVTTKVQHQGSRWAANSTQPESPATRMKREVEEEEVAAKILASQPPPPKAIVPPPSPHDFPALSPTAAEGLPPRKTAALKTSYVDVATNGMTALLGSNYTGSMHSTGNTFVSPKTASNSVVSSPTAAKKSPATVRGRDGQPMTSPKTADYSHGVSSKASPHFAQPTKSFSRRTDETVRRDSVLSPASKTNRETSPSKTSRTVAVHQKKRTSLPGEWVDCQSLRSRDPSPVKTLAFFPPSAGVLQMVSALDKAGTSARDQSPPKKTGTYMSPTKSTKRRSLANLADEDLSQTSPRLDQSLPQLDTSLQLTSSLALPAHDTASVDDTITSVETNIITEVAQTSFGAACQEEHKSDSSEEYDTAPNSPSKVPQEHGYASGVGYSSCWCESPETQNPGASAGLELDGAGDHDVATSKNPVDKSAGPMTSAELAIVEAKSRAAGLPYVSNTTTTRRQSHGQMLAPIKAKLGRLGLLMTAQDAGIADVNAKPVRSAAPKASWTMVDAPTHLREPPVDAGATGVVPKPKALPPHLCVRGNQLSTTTLRATAKEFKPTLPRVEEHAASDDEPATLLDRTEDDWFTHEPASPEHLRRLSQPGGVLYDKEAAPSEYDSLAACDGQMWDSATSQHHGVAPAVTSPHIPMKHFRPDKPMPIHSDFMPETGYRIKPYVDPSTGVFQWIGQTAAGIKEQIAMPPCSPPDQPLPQAPITSARTGWEIGSNTSQWKGGDGREIKFVGHGADVERDPNRPVSFGYSRSSKPGKQQQGTAPHFVDDDKENRPASPPLAPRSMRQWADSVGSHMVPCGKLEVTDFYEFFPQSNDRLWGFCNSCTSLPEGADLHH